MFMKTPHAGSLAARLSRHLIIFDDAKVMEPLEFDLRVRGFVGRGAASRISSSGLKRRVSNAGAGGGFFRQDDVF